MSTISGTGGYASSNGWTALTNPWGSSDLTYGKDYAISATYNSDNLVGGGLTFNWSYPKNNLPWTAIKAYPDVGFGASPWGRGQSDPAHVFPIKVEDLKDLDMAYDVTYGGQTSGFNVSYDIWFTSEPNGDTSTITTELMLWLHKGGVNAFGKLMGTYSDENFTGKIYKEGTYIAIISDTDLTKGEIDLTAVVNKLVGMGLMSSEEYLANIQFGAEVVEGTGSLTINNLEYDVVSINADGQEIHQTVTGLGVEGVNEIEGTSGNDYLPGDSLDNVVHAGAGNDDIQPGKGNDTVYAGAGNDKIFAGEGNDIVYGEDGDDIINGDAGNDELHGGAGNDIFLDVLGANKMFGDDGNDAFYLSGATVGSEIHGGNGNDTITAGSGHDVIFGDAGNDTISAGAGDDVINGGTGNDTITVGAGKDTVVVDIDAGNDIVKDFSVAEDVLELHYDAATLGNPKATDYVINGISSAMVAFGSSTVFLQGVKASTLTDKNYSFVNDKPVTADGTDYASKFYIQNSGASYNFTATHNAMRFEVHKGDIWGADTAIKERSEVAMKQKLGFGETYEINFGLTIEPGAKNTAEWLALMQINSTFDVGESHSPQFAIEMVGEKMRIVTRDDPSGAAFSAGNNFHYVNQYTDVTDIIRGKEYEFKIVVKFNQDATGTIVVYRDGVKLVDYAGPLGFNDAVGPYIKQGIYRESSDEAMAANYTDLTVKKVDVGLTFEGSTASEVINGGAGDDVFNLSAGNDTLYGNQGNDVFNYAESKGHNKIYGGIGNDSIYAGSGNDVLYGDAGDDIIHTGNGNNVAWGGDGADAIYGGSGKDVIWGDAGNDKIEGGAGNDVLFGGAGVDTLSGGDGDDEVYGDDGNDIMTGDAGNDLMHGGAGNDYINGGAGNDIVIGGDGDDIVRGGDGDDEVYGDAGNDTLYGDAGNDKIFGHAGNDKLYGGDGNDIMGGGEGDDILYGDAGNDMFFLSEGVDTIYGGLGKDQYKFTKEGLNGVDKIYFNLTEGDWLDFTMIIDQKIDVTSKNIGEFLKATQVGNDTVISVDVDGAANGSKFTDAAVLVGEHNVDLTAWIKSGNIVA